LSKALDEQREAFQAILGSKNGLIGLFEEALRKKDDDYRRSLKEENEDIDKIIALMRRQYYELRDSYLGELTEVEQKYDQDRGELLKSNKTEIEKKSGRHAELEKKIVEDRETSEKKNMEEIEKLRIDFAKGYADKKTASSHMPVSKIKPCMCKYELIRTVKLRMAH